MIEVINILQNIFVVSRSPLWVKIGDFGISKRLNEETQIRTAIYTPRYAAPEICGCSPYNAYLDSNSAHSMAVDIWSVGIITHELLTKEIPFANSMQIVHYTEGRIGFPTRALDATGTSSAAKTFIKRAMGVSPGDRPTCRDLLCDEWMKSESLEAANATKEFIDSLDDFLEFNDSSDSTNRRGPLVDASTFYPSSAQA